MLSNHMHLKGKTEYGKIPKAFYFGEVWCKLKTHFVLKTTHK
jgi:hypothetical protein